VFKTPDLLIGGFTMANIASVMKEEISRLSRKEIKSEVSTLRKSSSQYRSDIAALKRRVSTLEQQLSRVLKSSTMKSDVEVPAEAKTKQRFTVKGFKSLRNRLGLSAESAGVLIGVAPQTIYNWEAGKSSPRESQLERIVHLRGMGKRDVAAVLNQQAN